MRSSIAGLILCLLGGGTYAYTWIHPPHEQLRFYVTNDPANVWEFTTSGNPGHKKLIVDINGNKEPDQKEGYIVTIESVHTLHPHQNFWITSSLHGLRAHGNGPTHFDPPLVITEPMEVITLSVDARWIRFSGRSIATGGPR